MTHSNDRPLYLWLTKQPKDPLDAFLEAAITKFAGKWWNKEALPPNTVAAHPQTLTDDFRTQAAKYGLEILEVPTMPAGVYALTKSDLKVHQKQLL